MSANGLHVNRLHASKRARKPASRRAMVSARPRLALAITIGLGIAIPALTLALSTIAGTLAANGHAWLAVGACAVGWTVLAVSLSHLAWAVGDITHSSKPAAWLLAVAVDLSIVLAEAVRVFAADSGLCLLSTGLLISVTVCSMCLNVWAFLRHR